MKKRLAAIIVLMLMSVSLVPGFAPGASAVGTPGVVPPKINPPVVTPPKINPPVVTPPKINPPAVTPPKINPPVVTPPKINPPVVTPPKIDPPAVVPPISGAVPQTAQSGGDSAGEAADGASSDAAAEPASASEPGAEEIEALNALYDRAKSSRDGEDGYDAGYVGKVIVAVYSSGGSTSPRVLTSGSPDAPADLQPYLADSFAGADQAAIIFPTYRTVGTYSSGGAAEETTTWLTLFDLRDGRQFRAISVVTNDPPQVISVPVINGTPVSSGASGRFDSDMGLTRLVTLIRATRYLHTPTPAPTPAPTPTPYIEQPEEIGSVVAFGRYEQDGDPSNGPEDIEWIVLESDGETVALISKYALDNMTYNIERVDMTWEECNLRRWLNNKFPRIAFSTSERAMLQTVTADADGGASDSGVPHLVYLLSVEEAERCFPTDADRLCFATEACAAREAHVSGETGACTWYLRTAGRENDLAAEVEGSGRISTNGRNINGLSGVRPVIRLSHSDLLKAMRGEIAAEDSAPAAPEERFAFGQLVVFGRYEQDDDPANGPEPIQWRVLENDGETAVLMSRYALAAARYHREMVPVTWEECDLRKWLNGDFLEAAFTPEERERIPETEVVAWKPDDPKYDEVWGPPGNDTVDKVYVLDRSEYSRYFDIVREACALPTKAAAKNGRSWFIDETGCLIWMRSIGHSADDGSHGSVITGKGNEWFTIDVDTLCFVAPVIRMRLADLDPAPVPQQESDVAFIPAPEGEEGAEQAAPEPTPAPTPEPAGQNGEAAGDETLGAVIDALGGGVYRETYEALRAGEVIRKGSKGTAAKGVQQTLAAFGQDIAVDGNVGAKTIAALNAVQAAFGMEETDALDAEGYARLLPGLLIATDPDRADALLGETADAGEYAYLSACAMDARGRYASAKALFEESGWKDWESRAADCVRKWPKTGVLYKNPKVKGSAAELTVKFNTDPDTAMLVKIYTADGVLARTMFIGGTGKATTSLPAGTYVIKDGIGSSWYGEEEAFGPRPEGTYEIMTFDGGQQEIHLKKNYASTITVNVREGDPAGEGVGSEYEDWENF